MNKSYKKIFIFCLLCLFVMTGLVGCGKDGVKVSSANALARKLTNHLTDKVNVSEDFILEEPIIITGEKEIVGEGTITAVLEGSEEAYMFIVADGGKLTVGGSVKIDAAGLMGAIHVQDGGSVIVQEEAVIMNASKESANAFNEGSLEIAGGTLKDAKGHNIVNKKETVVSGGEIIGSGEKFAGIYNEGTLTQKGGTISKAYNNVSNIKGSTFTFESGTNKESTKDGVFVANGATMKATNKEAVIENATGRGILLHGQADIKVITIKGCGDTLIKVNKTGVLNLGNGILQEGNYHGVENAGTMNMLGGNIQANKNCGIVNTGTLKITSGNIANNENKGILNKHEGTADVTSAMVTLTSNKTAIANEDKAVFEFAKAKVLMSTQTNIYCYDGTINIHDAALNASTSNNVRIVDGTINMTDVEVKGNSQKSGTSHHGIYMEGGVINAENVTVSMTTGNGIRNKGGVFKGTNIVMHDINRVAVSQAKHDYLDVEGLTEINGLEIQSTNYANIVNDGGGTIKITDGKLAIASSNSVRSNDGKMELTNVTIPGHKEGSKDNIHGIYLEGGEIVAKKVTIENVSGNALRNKNGKFIGTNIKMVNIKGQTAIANLPLNDDEKDGIITIDGLTIKNSVSKNITLDSGVTTIKNATLGPTGGNNIKMQNNAATLNLYNVEIQGQVKDATANTHGIMVEGGNVFGEKVSIAHTNACAIRSKLGKVELKDVTMTELGQAGISNSKMGDEGVGHVTIDGLTLTKAGTNNVVLDAGKVILRNAVLGKVETDNHNVKVSGAGFLSLNGVEIQGTTSDSKYGVIVEGGEAAIKNTKIYDLAKSGIHANKETSKVTGENVTIENGKYGITGSNGSISLDNVKTANISENNILAEKNLQVALTNSTLGVTTGHNVKATRNALVSLNGTVLEGVTDGSKHGIMAEGGDFELKDVTIKNVKNTAIRINDITSTVNGKNITITDSGNGVTGTNGKVVIDGLTTTGITGNNVVADSSAKFTIKNANLCKVTGDAHNVKVAGNGKLKMTDSVINGTTSDSKYGIIAEGGEAELKNIEIYDVAKSGIHANKESSIVIGKNITIANGAFGITGSAGNIVIEKLKTSDITDNNILISGTCDVTVTKSAGGYGLGETDGHSVKVTDDAVVTLETVEIKGVTAGDKHGVMAEGGDVNLTNVNIHDVNGTAIRINKTTSEVNGKDIIIKNSANGVTGSAGTVVVDGLTTSQIDNNNALSSGANISIKNGDLGNTAGHNVKSETNGILKFEDTTINGITVTNKYGVMAEGGYVSLDNVTIKNVPTRAIYSNTDSSVVKGKDVTILKSEYGVYATKGSITIDKLTSSATTSNVTISGGTTTITNSELNKTADSNVVLSGGTLTLDEVKVNGTSANHGVLVSGGNAILKDIEILNSASAGIMVEKANAVVTGEKVTINNATNAIWVYPAGKVVVDGMTTSGMSGNNIRIGYDSKSLESDGITGEVTINKYPDGKKSVLGETNGHNVVAYVGKVTLNDASVNGTSSTGDTNGNSAIFAHGGDVDLTKVDITGANGGTGIRINRATSLVKGNTVTINDCNVGIEYSGDIDITGLICNATTHNVNTTGGTFTIEDGTFGKTANSNLIVNGGTLNLKGTTTVNGSETANGIEVVKGTLNLEGNVTVTDVAPNKSAIYNAGGTIVGADNSTVALTNVGANSIGIYNIGTANTTLKAVTLTGTAYHTIKNEGTGTLTIDGGSLGVSTGNNVYVAGGLVTLKNLTISGATKSGAHGVLATGGDVELNTVTIQNPNGGTACIRVNHANSEVTGTNVTVQNAPTGLQLNAGTTTITGLTATNITNNNISMYDGGTLIVNGGTLNKTTESNVLVSAGTVTLNNVIIGTEDNASAKNVEVTGGTVTINGNTLYKTADANVSVAGGTVTLNNVVANGSTNTRTIDVSGGTLNLQGTNSINNSSWEAIYNNGGTIESADDSAVAITNVGANSPAIYNKGTSNTSLKNVTLTGTTYHAVKNEGNSTLTIDGGSLGISTGNNVYVANGLVTLKNLTISGATNSGAHGVLATGGDVELETVTIQNPNGGTACIRVNNANSEVTGTDVTLQNAPTGLQIDAGTTTITNLTATDITNYTVNMYTAGTLTVNGGTIGKTAQSNITVDKGTVTLNDVTIGTETEAGSKNVEVKAGAVTINRSTLHKTTEANVLISGGTITLEDVTVNGSTGSYGIEVSGGTLNLKGNVTVKDTKLQGIYNHGGTINGSTANSLMVQNTGKIAIWNVTDTETNKKSSTTLKNVTISGVQSGHSIKNEGAESTITIDGGEFAQTPSNNVYALNGTVTLKNLTVNGTSGQSTNNLHGILASGGDVVLEKVTVKNSATGAIRVNNANSKVEGTDIKFENGYIGISANKGETIINGLTTSGLTQNNILASGSAKVTVNAYADGTKSVLGTTTTSHNVKSEPDAIVTLNNVAVNGSTGNNAIMAEGGDFVLNNVDIAGNATKTGIRSNNSKSSVKGTNITISNFTEGISNGGTNGAAALEFENLSISNITGTNEFWNQGTLKLAGEIDANIHNDQAVTVEATKALKGDISVDWTNGKEPAIAIQFASAADLEASRDCISLGPVQAAKHELEYFDTYATFAVPVLVTGDYGTLQDALNAIASTDEKTGIIRLQNDLTLSEMVAIPENVKVTIVDNGETRTITRASNYLGKLISIPSSSTVTLVSSSKDNENPSLIFDGGSKADGTGIKCTGSNCLVENNGNLMVYSGVSLQNNLTSGNFQGIALYAQNDSNTIFKGVIKNIYSTNIETNGYPSSVCIKSKVVFENALVENNVATKRGLIRLNGNGNFTATNTVFDSNQSAQGGILFVDSNEGNELLLDNCTFTNNKATGHGGAISIENTADKNTIRNTTFTGNESGGEGGAISIATGAFLNLKNCMFTNNVTTKVDDVQSISGFGDVRVADNTNNGAIRIAGKMVVDIYLNQAGKILVNGPLTEGSDVIANWRISKNPVKITGQTFEGIIFNNVEDMQESKSFISQSANYSSTYDLVFRDAKGILQKK